MERPVFALLYAILMEGTLCFFNYFSFSKPCYAQTIPDGIYLNCEELKNKTPFYRITDKDVLKYQFPPGFNNIKVITLHQQNKGIKTIYYFKRGSIFAYQSKENYGGIISMAVGKHQQIFI